MPTQKELAKLAGVSAGTVSNVISGSKRVSEKARKKVLDAIQKLDYQPNLIARSLKTNRTNTLGIIIPEITVPFFPQLIRGAEFAARDRGCFLIVLDSDADPALEIKLISLLRSQRVDGILLVTAAGKWPGRETPITISSRPPLVCLDRIPDGFDVDSVSVDGKAAAEMGVSHLLSLGHREIGLITGPLNLKHEQERLAGYRQALRKAGIKVRESWIWASSFDRAEIDGACRSRLLQVANRPTALFTTNGVVALGALSSIYGIGLSVPNDIAFVTMDEISPADFFQPAITAIVQPTFDLGYRAVEMVLERISKGEELGPRQTIHLPASLVVRASSGVSRRR